MKPLLIGLAGPMGSGKSTVASHLVTEHNFIEYSFAQPLKDALCALLGITPERLELLKRSELPVMGPRGDQQFPPVRRLLQTLGTEWGRQIVHPELWLALAEQRLDAIAAWDTLPRSIVISDVRFETEAAFIRRRGGVVIHIQRHHQGGSDHISERPLVHAYHDYMLANQGTPAQLQHGVDALLAVIAGARAGDAA